MQCHFNQIRRVAAPAMVSFAALVLYGQSPVPLPDMELFETWLDRADYALTRDQWDTIALEGERTVMARWEQNLLMFIESGQLKEIPAEQLEVIRSENREVLSDALADRLTNWLLGKFVRDYTSFGYAEFVDTLRDERNSAMFVMESGSVLRDEEGRARMVPLDSTPAFEEELARWNEKARDIQSGLLDRWRSGAATAFRELAGSVDDKTRLLLESRRDILFSDMEGSLRRQGDALFLIEQSEYRRLRLQDHHSLRRGSEQLSAAVQTEEILEKTESALKKGLDTLTAGLEETVMVPEPGSRLLDGEAWQEQFRLELARGLELWNEAGEAILTRRMEWEQKAGEDLAAGMEAWEAALQTIHAEQRAWLVELDSLRQEGEELFYAEFNALREAQQAAIDELEAGMAESRNNLAEEIGDTVDNLNRSLQMMKTSRESIVYWLSSIPDGNPFNEYTMSWDAPGILDAILGKMTSDVLNNSCGIYSPIIGRLFSGSWSVQQRLTRWMEHRVLEKIDELFEGIVRAAHCPGIWKAFRMETQSIHGNTGKLKFHVF